MKFVTPNCAPGQPAQYQHNPGSRVSTPNRLSFLRNQVKESYNPKSTPVTVGDQDLQQKMDESSGRLLVASMGSPDSSHEKRPLKRPRPSSKAHAGEPEHAETAPDTPPSRPTRCNVQRGEPCLPWLPDRFYINELPCLREGGLQYSTSNRQHGGLDVFFSLKRLLDVVNGDGWPGLKGAILGTFSLNMRRLTKECPGLMATPALILHGDRSLRRANTNDHPGIIGSPNSSTGGEEEASRSDRGESACLVQAGIKGDVSPERRRIMEQGGRRDRSLGWKMQLPADVDVVKVAAGRWGVHHPKFGLLFLKDGSLVMYVSTGNLGSDTAIDATWVQRFGAKAANAATMPLSSEKKERRGRLSDNEGMEIGTAGSGGIKPGGVADGEGIWKGDFAETLQDFLEQESRLISRYQEMKRRRPTTPVEFMRRVMGVTHVGESFDFSEAAVDLIPTVPTEIPGEEDESGRSRLTMPSPLCVPCQDQRGRYVSDPDGGHESGGDGDCRRRQHYYGQLRIRYVLGRRRREAGELGPRDSLIVQPTSLGIGVDHAFMEVFAANCMPDSIEPCDEAWREHFESRLESSKIVWPSAQYMDACRSEMSKSPCFRDRQVATVMEVSRQYVLGESGKDIKETNCPFLFMTPQILESMGVDLRDCLRTFHLHSALGLPLRPAHMKSAMRLRPAPLDSRSRRSVKEGEGSSKDGCISESSGGRVGGVRKGNISHSLVGEGRGPCEHAQHLAWFLLTSASLSQGAQGVVTHAPVTGVPTGANCKNFELGVLFHSTPTRAYYVEPVPDCGCGRVCGGSDPDLEAQASRVALGAAVERTGDLLRRRVYVPLPVPFRLESEPYSNPETGSPDLRFLPYMHLLKEFPRPAHIEHLLKSSIKEAQFA